MSICVCVCLCIFGLLITQIREVWYDTGCRSGLNNYLRHGPMFSVYPIQYQMIPQIGHDFGLPGPHNT